jgi:hypothetical protein
MPAVFNRLVATPPWTGPPVWIHGDLHPLNLLVADGRLRAVIDWGDVCAGDPATGFSIAWMVWPDVAHRTFRVAASTETPIDDATWARARGWALALSVAYLASSQRPPAAAGTAPRASPPGRLVERAPRRTPGCPAEVWSAAPIAPLTRRPALRSRTQRRLRRRARRGRRGLAEAFDVCPHAPVPLWSHHWLHGEAIS